MSQTMYKVTYYKSSSGSSNEVAFKMFNTFEESSDFSSKLGDKIIEIKAYEIPEHYPDSDLNLGWSDK